MPDVVRNPEARAAESPSRPVAVRILTDRAALASRLGRLLRDAGGFLVLGQPGTGPAAVLLMDCAPFDPRKRTRLRRAARRDHPARVLWLLDAAPASGTAGRSMLDAVKAGWCHGYVHDDCSAAVLVQAVMAVAAGDVWMPRAMLLRAFYEPRNSRGGGAASAAAHATSRARTLLTVRERQIFRLVRSGLTNKEVGRQLEIAEDTVKKHLRNMYAKLGVRRRAQMLAKGAAEARASR